jgi:hypothetical protein
MNTKGSMPVVVATGCWQPSARQAAFKEVSLEQCSQGRLRRALWFHATKGDARFPEGTVTAAEWKDWCAHHAFADWFFSAHDTEALDVKEQGLADNVFWDGLSKGMQAGLPWAFKTYASVRFRETEHGPQGQTAQDRAEMMSWINRDGGPRWRPHRGEA